MAYAVQVTLSTGNKVSLNYQSQEVSVGVTYQLERDDTGLLALVQEKTAELAQAHRLAWQGLHDAKVSSAPSPVSSPVQPVASQHAVASQPVASQQVDSQPANVQDGKLQESPEVEPPEKESLDAPEIAVETVVESHPITEPEKVTTMENGALASPPLPAEWIEPTAPLEPAMQGQRNALRVLLDQAQWQKERIAAHLLAQFGCENIEELTAAQAAEWLLQLQRAARVTNEQQRLQTSRNGAKIGTGKTDT